MDPIKNTTNDDGRENISNPPLSHKSHHIDENAQASEISEHTNIENESLNEQIILTNREKLEHALGQTGEINLPTNMDNASTFLPPSKTHGVMGHHHQTPPVGGGSGRLLSPGKGKNHGKGRPQVRGDARQIQQPGGAYGVKY